MSTLERAKKAFHSRHACKEGFDDSLPNFELFEQMIREDEREKCASICSELFSDERIGEYITKKRITEQEAE